MSVTMVALSGAPSLVETSTGHNYVPDANGVITVTDLSDVPRLMAAGFGIQSMASLDGVTAGVVTSSKGLIVDANKHIDTLGLPVSGLKIGASGSETAVDTTAAQLNFLASVTAGTPAASKALVLDANGDLVGGAAFRHLKLAGNIRHSNAVPAGAGTNQATATALSADFNSITGADNTVGVALPAAVAGDEIVVLNQDTSHTLKVYPVNGGSAAINGLSANAAFVMLPGERCYFYAESATQWRTTGLRVARNQISTASAADTVVTGLNQVVAALACYDDSPALANFLVSCTIGDQAGSPAAGSIIVKTWKATGSGDCTPIAATSFSKKVNWIAVGF